MSARIDVSVIRFGLVGAVNTVAGLAVIYAAKELAGAGDVEANLIGYGAGMLLSFAFNKRWTFGHSGDTLPAFFRFLAVVLIAYLLNLLAVVGLLDIGVDGYVAQALGVAPYAVFLYIGCKHVAFAPHTLQPDAP